MDRVLIVDKPGGVTSHDVVERIRRASGIRKVGHAGTLDPAATGVLVVLLGKATRLSHFLVESDKAYAGEIVLGVATSTQDSEGAVVATGSIEGISERDIREAFSSFVGDIEQTPPMVSAIKRDGVRLYVLARRGETVQREPRRVRVDSFKLLGYDPPRARFEVVCSRGTYVRTLAADVGDMLGCGGHLGRLARTRVGRFTLSDAVALDDLIRSGDAMDGAGYSMFDALSPWPVVELDEDGVETVSTGGRLTVEDPEAGLRGGEHVRLTGDGVTLLAVGLAGDRSPQDRVTIRPIRVFAQE